MQVTLDFAILLFIAADGHIQSYGKNVSETKAGNLA